MQDIYDLRQDKTRFINSKRMAHFTMHETFKAL